MKRVLGSLISETNWSGRGLIFILPPALYLVFKGFAWIARALIALAGIGVEMGWASPNVLGLSIPADKSVAQFLGAAVIGAALDWVI